MEGYQMRFPRTIAMILSVMAVALMSVGVASAAPTRNAEPFEIECDNGETYTIVTNGRGAFTPGFIIEGDRHNLIPIAFADYAVDEDGNVIFSENIEKNGERKGFTDDDLVTCTYSGVFEEDGQSITFFGVVTGFLTPRS